jgi:hypothetical protein
MIITAILGALTGLVPGVLSFFTKRSDNAHAIELRKLEIQAAKDGVALQVDLEKARSDVQQQQSIYTFANQPSGVRWVDAVTVLVRPYITLIVFHVWIGIEIALVYHAFTKGADIAAMAKAVWDDNTQAVFAAIVGFWFGNRMLARAEQAMAATVAVNKPPAVKKPDPTQPMKKKIKNEVDPVTGIIPLPPGDRT